jgi:hypothetical protein
LIGHRLAPAARCYLLIRLIAAAGSAKTRAVWAPAGLREIQPRDAR